MVKQALQPLIEDAINEIKKVKRAAVSELRFNKKPAKVLVALMASICIMLDVEPRAVKKEGAIVEEDWWTAA